MFCSHSGPETSRQSECGCQCGFGHPRFHFRRRFISPDEEKLILENYRTELQNELNGVAARLNQMEGK